MTTSQLPPVGTVYKHKTEDAKITLGSRIGDTVYVTIGINGSQAFTVMMIVLDFMDIVTDAASLAPAHWLKVERAVE